jgi:hypothetical protein
VGTLGHYFEVDFPQTNSLQDGEDALDRGEPVTISHRGHEKARLLPVQSAQEVANLSPIRPSAFGEAGGISPMCLATSGD